MILAALWIAAALFAVTASAGPRTQQLEALIDQAEVVAAVTILSTDYRATAADGPMYADAKLLKVIKGELSRAQGIHFGASAWVGPTYSAGQERIVFLAPVAGGHGYYKNTRWSSLEAGKVDLHFARPAIEELSESTLRKFLRGLAHAGNSLPKLECELVRVGDGNRQLSVRLTNTGDQTLWFHMSGLRFSFEAGQVRHAISVDWHADDKDNWFPLPPGLVLSGYAIFGKEQVAGAVELTVTLSHQSARFPESAWLGFQSVKLRVPE